MFIKFLKPKQGLGYFPGDVVEFSDEQAKELIEGGFATVDEEPETESDLPADLKGREALIKAGLVTIEQVLAAKETLTDVKGIGEKMATEIIATLTPSQD